jgi:hypothetical protein
MVRGAAWENAVESACVGRLPGRPTALANREPCSQIYETGPGLVSGAHLNPIRPAEETVGL